MKSDGWKEPTSRFLSSLGVLLLAAALIYSGWMMLHVFGGVFKNGYLGHNGARYSIMARNVLRADLSTANYAPLLNPALESDPDPYLHHPPLLHWVLAISFGLFGESEDHARAVPYFFTLLNVILIYLLGNRLLGGPPWGGVCAALAAGLPLTSYYGAHIDVQGSPLTFCTLACILFYCFWLHRPRRLWYVLAVIAMIVGTLFDWPALYLCALLPFHYWLRGRRDGRTLFEAVKSLGWFMACGAILFVLLVIWLSTAGESKGTSLFDSLMHRSLMPTTFLDIGDPIKYLLKYNCFDKTHTLCPWPFLLLIFLGWVLGYIQSARFRNARTGQALWLFFLLGTVHVVIFPFGTLFHDYWIFLYLPWAVLAGGLAIQRIALLAGEGAVALRALCLSLAVLALGGVLAGGHLYSLSRFGAEEEVIPVQLGLKIRENVEPGQAVLTNADHFNQPMPGDKDRYVLFKP
ncbi:MAG: ArnT family glycosyltransferase, partial [Planctomycetota bacterium]